MCYVETMSRAKHWFCLFLLALPALGDTVATNGNGHVPWPVAPLGQRLLFYIPDRLLDLSDMFRLRLKLGPGWGATARLTDYGAFFAGDYDTVYVGLPGPRAPEKFRWPLGREQQRGMILAGVAATDDRPHPPHYAQSELDAGLHALAGVEVGFDPMEFYDFLAGFLLFDPRGDDLETPTLPQPRWFRPQLALKPEHFDSLGQRLDYLHVNAPKALQEPVDMTDRYLGQGKGPLISNRPSKFRLGLYAEFKANHGLETRWEPSLNSEIHMANVERRFSIFVDTLKVNALPDTATLDKQSGLRTGVRRRVEDLHIDAETGVRVSWPPNAFARLVWRPRWAAGAWRIAPRQQLYCELQDRLGTLSSLSLHRWFGPDQHFMFQHVQAAKWTLVDHFTWEQTAKLGYVDRLLEPGKRGAVLDNDDIARGYLARYSLFGDSVGISTHRVTLDYRRPIYRNWLYLDLMPGVEWTRENDWSPTPLIQVGLDVLFWDVSH